MNREEILKAAQSNKPEMGEYEKSVTRKALMYGTALGILLCTVMGVVESWFFNTVDWGKPTILLAIIGFANLYEGSKCKNRNKVFGGLVEIIIAMVCLGLYVGALLG